MDEELNPPPKDKARISRNVDKMIAAGAPESDIEAYLQSEGLSPVAEAPPKPAAVTPPKPQPRLPPSPFVNNPVGRTLQFAMSNKSRALVPAAMIADNVTFGAAKNLAGIPYGIASLVKGDGFNAGYDEARGDIQDAFDDFRQNDPSTVNVPMIGKQSLPDVVSVLLDPLNARVFGGAGKGALARVGDAARQGAIAGGVTGMNQGEDLGDAAQKAGIYSLAGTVFGGALGGAAEAAPKVGSGVARVLESSGAKSAASAAIPRLRASGVNNSIQARNLLEVLMAADRPGFASRTDLVTGADVLGPVARNVTDIAAQQNDQVAGVFRGRRQGRAGRIRADLESVTPQGPAQPEIPVTRPTPVERNPVVKREVLPPADAEPIDVAAALQEDTGLQRTSTKSDLKFLEDQRREAARALYAEAEQQPVDYSDLAELFSRGGEVGDLLREAAQVGSDLSKFSTETAAATGGTAPMFPRTEPVSFREVMLDDGTSRFELDGPVTLGLMDDVQKGLGLLSEKLRNADSPLDRAKAGLVKQLQQSVLEQTQGRNPAYATARRTFKEDSDVMRAFELGGALKGTNALDVDFQTEGLSPVEKYGVQQGYLNRSVTDLKNRVTDPSNLPEGEFERISAIFGAEAAEKLRARFAARDAQVAITDAAYQAELKKAAEEFAALSDAEKLRVREATEAERARVAALNARKTPQEQGQRAFADETVTPDEVAGAAQASGDPTDFARGARRVVDARLGRNRLTPEQLLDQSSPLSPGERIARAGIDTQPIAPQLQAEQTLLDTDNLVRGNSRTEPRSEARTQFLFGTREPYPFGPGSFLESVGKSIGQGISQDVRRDITNAAGTVLSQQGEGQVLQLLRKLRESELYDQDLAKITSALARAGIQFGAQGANQ